ncbi:MAG TPA: amino acid permease [Sedimentisphaerales bacterium]|nr:amino acid permease [Sedimentisphaerales bacterium]HRS09954.1 amino acid permease [Sedimentisphaerales bacterium]HRV46660.1 amino acid permease [Sedimentisphaerales bacterium]
MPTQELQRGYGLSTSTYVVIASMVGTGILVSPGYMMASLGNYPVIFGLWALGGLLALCGALCVAELAAALPRAGGEYVYLREAYGPMPAFLSGWTSFFVGFSAPLAVAGYIAASYLLSPFGLDMQGNRYTLKVAAAAIILVVTLPNLLGHRHSARTQSLTTILKLGLFAALVVGAALRGTGRLTYLGQGRPLDTVAVGTAATQLFYVMFAYSGWNAASYLAGEVRDPAKTLPRSLLLGTGVVVMLYLALNLVFACAVPLTDVGFDNAEQIPQLAVAALFGSGIGDVFSVLLGLTFLATVSAFVITGPRVYYAMACDGLFPSIAGRTNRQGVPACAMVLQSVCAVIILFATDFQNLYRYAAVGLSLFALLFIGAVYVLRQRRAEMERPFRVPGYPITPAIFMAVTLFMAVYAFMLWPTPSLWSVGSILLGIPVYYIWVFVRRRLDAMGRMRRCAD